MKKLWLIMAVAMSLAVACGKNNPQPQKEEPQKETPVTPTPTPTPTPEQKETPKPETVRLVVSDEGSSVKYIELTESGTYLLCEVNADKDYEYSFGNYTVDSDGQFILGKDAVLTYEQTGSPVTFTLKKNDGKTISGKATPNRNTSTSGDVKKLCKTWVINKTRVSITDGAKANADFTGCNLGEIAEFARNQGIEIKKDFNGISITSITVMPTGSVIILYSTGRMDVADCDFSKVDKGTLKFSWHDESALGYELANGNADIAFQGDYCLLTVASDFTKDSKKYAVSVTFVLAEKK